ncbi:hypothetical protein [Spirosoma koreense]
MSQHEVIQAFNALPPKQRLAIAKKIQLQMADELFDDLDAELPNVSISTQEIQQEIIAYRNAQKKKD